MSSKREVLESLKRAELHELAGHLQLDRSGRSSKHELLDAIERSRKLSLADALAHLTVTRLKELCSERELEQTGPKATLIERLTRRRNATVTPDDADDHNGLARELAPSKAPAQAPLPFSQNVAVSLSELESHLWEAANILRGSPVDRSDWKSYILPLLFFKRICDVWDEEHASMITEYGEDFADEHRFQVPVGCHWANVRAAPKNVGAALANAMRGVEAANQKHLYGVFGDVQWTNKDRLPDELLKDLIEHFSMLSLGNAHVASDVIGDAYEYLIKQFADTTNKKAGEFYTPRSVVRLIVDILNPKEGETVYDPACGTGGMLLAAVEHVRDRGGDPRTFFGKLYGQEKNLTTAAVARMNLFLHGIEDFDIQRGDTLRSPVFTDPSTGALSTFDVVIANPPFSLEQWGREVWESDPWGRVIAGLPTDGNADMAWVQHMVKSMAPKSGRMGVVLPQGALFRGGIEAQIRKHLLEKDLVEAVIGLAPNLFYGTTLAACVLVLRARKEKHRKGKVLVVDASNVFRRERAQNILDTSHLEQIRAWVLDFAEVKDRVRVVDLTAIEKEDWSLNVARYVLPTVGADIPRLSEAVAAFKEALAKYREDEDRLRRIIHEGGWLS
jgi:type I restriction enzyme M protein